MKMLFAVLFIASAIVLCSTRVLAQAEWIPWTGDWPENAVAGGEENGKILYVCRAENEGAKHPGKLLEGHCNIGWGGKELVLDSYDILVNNGGIQLVWEGANNNKIPHGAVQGGTENGRPLVVGQLTRPDGSVHPGKVFRGDDGLLHFNYGYGGDEVSVTSGFRVMVARLVGN